MKKEEVIGEIIDACCEIEACNDIPFMIALAEIESSYTFNPKIQRTNSQYVGLYQLSDGKYGCKGEDRRNIKISTEKTGKGLHKTKIKKEGEVIGETWFGFGYHNLGDTGFQEVYDYVKGEIKELSQARKNAINNNKPPKYNTPKNITAQQYFYGGQENFNRRMKYFKNQYSKGKVACDKRQMQKIIENQQEPIKSFPIQYPSSTDKTKVNNYQPTFEEGNQFKQDNKSITKNNNSSKNKNVSANLNQNKIYLTKQNIPIIT